LGVHDEVDGEDVRPGFVERFMGAGGGGDVARRGLGGGGGGGLLPEVVVGVCACATGGNMFEVVVGSFIPPMLTFANRDFKSFTAVAGGSCSLVVSCCAGCAVGGGLNLFATV
jgi:hypothetical protein